MKKIPEIRIFRKNLRKFERLNQILNSHCCEGVTMAQCHVLLEIEDMGEATTKELAQNLKLAKSTLSRTIDDLFKKGLVERKENKQDRRFTLLHLTKKGIESCITINQANDKTYRELFLKLSINDQEKIFTYFNLLIKAMDECYIGARTAEDCCSK